MLFYKSQVLLLYTFLRYVSLSLFYINPAVFCMSDPSSFSPNPPRRGAVNSLDGLDRWLSEGARPSKLLYVRKVRLD